MAAHSFGTFIGFFVGSQARTIGEVRNINGPGKTMTAADASHLRVTNALKAFVPGLKDGGEVTLTVNFTGTLTPTGIAPNAFARQNYANVFSLWDLRTESYWFITYPFGSISSGTERFWAFVTNLGTAVPEDDVITADITLKASGDESNAHNNKAANQKHSFA